MAGNIQPKDNESSGRSGVHRVVCWERMTTPYGVALARSLASGFGLEAVCVAESDATRSYWNNHNIGTARLLSGLTVDLVDSLVGEAQERSLHIFSHHFHPRGLPNLNRAFRACLQSPTRVALLGEGETFGGPRRILRRALDTYYALRFSSRIGFILGQGLDAESWFRSCGYPRRKIVPFGFFVDDEGFGPNASGEPSHAAFVMVYIGHCIERKGIDIMLRALAELKETDWRLIVLGDGDKRPELESMTERLGLADRVEFRGFVSRGDALSELCRSDLLVLPSTYDTWGVVVNEALVSGVPAVCSDRCGAKELLDGSERGAVFKSGSIEALRDLLAERMADGKKTPSMSARIKEWARVISGESIAGYVVDVIEWAYAGAERPVPPWLKR